MRGFLLALGVMVAAATALADEGGAPSAADRARARQLDDEAEKLIAEGKLEEALGRYEQSARLVDVPAHWLMIGRVRVKLHRLVAGVEAYERAAGFPADATTSKASRAAVETAKKELAALRPRLAELRLRVIGNGEVSVTVNGRRVTSAADAVPLDPGSHRIVARADGMRPLELDVALAEGERAIVPLVLAPAAPPREAPPAERAAPSFPVLATIAFALGGAGLVVGGVTGAMALAHASELDELCGEGRAACPPGEASRIDDAVLLGHVSTAGFAVGGVGVAGGVIALLADDDADNDEDDEPSSGVDGARRVGLCAAGAWLGVCGAW
jgi:hypothetical protein